MIQEKLEKENMVRKKRTRRENIPVRYEVRPAIFSFSRVRKKIVCGDPKQRTAS
jgi:hypothetical protein